MLIPIAIDLSLTETNAPSKHDFGDATALANYIISTPCILLHNGQSFGESLLYSLLNTLPPSVRANLVQCLVKMPTYRVADWDGTCGQALPPYSYLRGSIFAVPRNVFESLNANGAKQETVTIQAGTIDITMWHTIQVSQVHQRISESHSQNINIGTNRDVLWGSSFESIVKHAKIRTITIVDRYAFKRGNETDTRAIAVSYFLKKIQEQSKSRDETISVTILVEAHKYTEDELATITETLAAELSDRQKILKVHICAMLTDTMVRFFHERYVFIETSEGILYETMIGRGMSVFSNITVELASILILRFHWLAGDSTLYSDAKKRTSVFRHKEWYRVGKVFVNIEG